MGKLLIRRLGACDADSSYVLARLSDPALTPDAWRAILAAAPDRAGVIGAFSRQTVRAVLQYSIVVKDGGERLFVIDGLAAFDLFDPTTTANALLAEARRQADISCSGLALSARLGSAGIDDLLRCAAGTAVLHRVF
nr:hypothetical protein [uncultured Brevundimonas sp.]